jgi:hypothetical protein
MRGIGLHCLIAKSLSWNGLFSKLKGRWLCESNAISSSPMLFSHAYRLSSVTNTVSPQRNVLRSSTTTRRPRDRPRIVRVSSVQYSSVHPNLVRCRLFAKRRLLSTFGLFADIFASSRIAWILVAVIDRNPRMDSVSIDCLLDCFLFYHCRSD